MTVTIARAAPYLTVQDFGRLRYREFGVPRGGAMDRFALGAANALAGNETGAAGLEWALGGGSLRFDVPCTFALDGAVAEATLDGVPVQPRTTAIAVKGATLEIGRFMSGRFLYVAIHGGVAVDEVLGSRSTYLPAHFGGLAGRLVGSGDVLPLGPSTTAPAAGFAAPGDLGIDYSRRIVRVVPGPQWSLFTESDRDRFFTERYTVDPSSNRMGYRLAGSPMTANSGLLPSEAACEGAVQVPPNGLPIVLMADSPTVGGYPKIGVVATNDLPLLAQLQPGESFRFEQTTVHDAQRRLRRSATALYTLGSLAARH